MDNLFRAIIYNNEVASDTVNISISILNKAPIITGIQTAFRCNTYKLVKFKKGDKVYVDRTTTFESIPDQYLDCTLVKGPANDGHRFDLGDTFITFTANKDITLFIGYDKNSLELMPDWLKEWSDTEDEILNSWGNSYRLYSKTFTQGEVILGNNTTEIKPLRLMYLILAKESE
jgi:hypothetical protein